MSRVIASLTLALVLLAGAPKSSLAEPGACSSDLDDFVLPCFKAYKSDLRAYHFDEIERIADAIAKRVRDGEHLNTIAIYGFGVVYKADDPAYENSKKRAEAVRRELSTELEHRSLNFDPERFIVLALGDTRSTETTTQDERWLLRRVELSVTFGVPTVKKKKSKKKACRQEKPQFVKRLQGFSKNYSNAGRQHAVRCLSKLLVRYFSCKVDDLDSYFHTRSSNIALWMPLADRWERGRAPLGDFPCAKKKGVALKRCMGTLDGDIVEGIDTLNRRIMRVGMDAQPNHVRAMAECRTGRTILSDFEQSKTSPYACYPTQAKAFKACRSSN